MRQIAFNLLNLFLGICVLWQAVVHPPIRIAPEGVIAGWTGAELHFVAVWNYLARIAIVTLFGVLCYRRFRSLLVTLVGMLLVAESASLLQFAVYARFEVTAALLMLVVVALQTTGLTRNRAFISGALIAVLGNFRLHYLLMLPLILFLEWRAPLRKVLVGATLVGVLLVGIPLAVFSPVPRHEATQASDELESKWSAALNRELGVQHEVALRLFFTIALPLTLVGVAMTLGHARASGNFAELAHLFPLVALGVPSVPSIIWLQTVALSLVLLYKAKRAHHPGTTGVATSLNFVSP